MGNATYYLKAKFPSMESLSTALPEIIAFILEGIKAEKWWEEHRTLESKGDRELFWLQFRPQFPTVYHYLQYAGFADGDCNSALSNIINFGNDETVATDFFDDLYPNNSVACFNKPLFMYNAYVWHLAVWDYFCDYLELKFGAISAEYLSDEDIDPYDLL